MRPLVISHAACGGHAPPNTLAGVRKAIELGADGIEIDLQASSDGVPVLMHDLTVDRTTNGSGAVAELAVEELRKLDAGGGEPVPTIDEVLEITNGKVLLVMEIKQPGIEPLLADAVHKSNALRSVMAWSFFPQAIEGMRLAEPRIPCGLLVSREALANWPETRERALTLGVQAVSVFAPGINRELARDCQLSGLSLYTWTPDTEAEIAKLIELGVDGICTNYPDRALNLLARS
jgi:glycerophosphoryl diester phosphodiesterase